VTSVDGNVRGVLLDIEGTTSSIEFVHRVMFSFVLEHLDSFLHENFADIEVAQAVDQMARDAGFASLEHWVAGQGGPPHRRVKEEVARLTAENSKATGLKMLQGLVWRGGFESGQLKAHVFPDVVPAIQCWREQGKDIRIYSSGSIVAQKLFFGHVDSYGDCLHLFSGHYDTTIGGKKQSESYQRIAENWGLAASEILFISDVAEELIAAQQAGYKTLASDRPGNQELPEDFDAFRVRSFSEIEFSS
jgi:enolase-phosphatase E1